MPDRNGRGRNMPAVGAAHGNSHPKNLTKLLYQFTSDLYQFTSNLYQFTSELYQFTSELYQFTSELYQFTYIGLSVHLYRSISSPL